MTLTADADPQEVPIRHIIELLESEERELLRRCAVPRTFDRAAVSSVLMPDAPSDTLDALLELGLVEAARGAEGDLHVPSLVRAVGLEAWREDRGRLDRLQADLARHWQDERPEEAFYLLVGVDQEAALAEFRRRFDAADARFDLTACESLLAILDAHLDVLATPLRDARDEARARLARRLDSADDFYRTKRFLERRDVREQIDAFLAGRPGPVMQLRAPGGMGKTMHLRWLAARICAPRHIACARLDFDAVVPTVALEEPWLVVLALADRLNQQLEGTPLTDVLSEDVATELPRLWRTRIAGAAPTGTPRRGARLGERVVARVARALSQLPSDRPAVMVLDTMEVAILRTGASLAPLVERLRTLQSACPALRLVFAGRFDLAQRVPQHADFFDDAPRLRLEPFTVNERTDYLERIRGFDDPALVATIAARSDGSPFKLALIADIVQNEGGLEAEDLAAYDRVDLMYLIRRVLLRIEDMHTRWLLRYGAIPNLLDRGLMERVMLSVLEREVPRRAEARDEPERGLADADAETWAAKAPPEKVDELWDGLQHHADDASWVTVEGERGQETMILKPEVLQPMRRLVREQPELHRELHERAAAEFRARAGADAGNWQRWTSEELYHRLHADPGQGEASVYDRLGESADRPQDRRLLIDHLLSHEYVVAELLGEPDDAAEPGDTRVALSPALVSELLHQSALLTLDSMRRGDESAWDACRQALVRHDRLRERTGAGMNERRLVLLRAAVDFHAPGRTVAHVPRVAERWAQPLRAAAGTLPTANERIHALMLHADLVAQLDPDAATRSLRDALREVGLRRIDSFTRIGIGRRLAEHLFRSGDAGGALRELKTLRGSRVKTKREEALLGLQEARITLYAGEPARATQTATCIAEYGADDQRARALLIAAQAALAARQTADASRLVEEARRAAPPGEADLRIEMAAVESATYAALGLTARAVAALDDGDRQAGNERGPAVQRLLSTRLAVDLRLRRDLKEADTTLYRAASLMGDADDYSALTLRLQRVEWLTVRGQREDAAAELDAIAFRLQRDGAPVGHNLRVALEGMTLDDDARAAHLERLVRMLERITPPAARVSMLRELSRARPLPPDLPGSRRLVELVRAAIEPAAGAPGGQDARVRDLALAEVCRVAAGPIDVAEQLRRVKGGGPRIDADWVESAARAGLPAGTAQRAIGLVRRLAEQAPGLALSSALAFARARLDVASGRDYLAIEALGIAARALPDDPTSTGAAALLAELRSRPGAAGAGPSDAEAHRDEALRLYHRLGDDVGAARVQTSSREAVQETGDDVTIAAGRLPDRLRALLEPDPDDTVSFALARSVADEWQDLAEELREALHALTAERYRARPRLLRLFIKDGRTHILPWELALATPDLWPEALSRGRGRAEAEEARERAAATGTGPADTPQAVVISPATEDLARRGSVSWPAAAADAYAAAGFRVQLITGAETTYALKLPRSGLAVVHLQAAILDARGGPAIDLTGAATARALHRRSGASDEEAVHAPTFARILSVAAEPARPLVVLEPPPPSNELEVGVQLCLRNLFAGALFDSGLVDAVVASGLMRDEQRLAAYRTLADGLAGKRPVGDAVHRLRATLGAHASDRLGALVAAAVALFAVDAALPVPFGGPQHGA